MIRWPEGLGPEPFLRDYWQKAPLFMPGGLPDLTGLPSPEELAGLACEPEIESRIVSGDSVSGWTVRHGPFEEQDFLDLPETGWTLLVQDVDKHLSDLSTLLGDFGFVPRWRLDDLMLSFAVPGGSVGPHIDAYDVFLIQVQGARTWELDPHPDDLSCRDDSDLRVLGRFSPGTRYRVMPGDVLYLPPGVAHFGHSTEPVMTCSVGFRAPSAAELLAAAGRLCPDTPDLMYRDPDMDTTDADGGRISPAALDRLRHLMRSAVRHTEARLEELLGRLATEGKPWLLPEAPDEAPEAEEILRRLGSGDSLERYPGSRFAWSASGPGCWLFVDGDAWPLPPSASMLCRALADDAQVDGRLIESGDTHLVAVLRELLANGSLVWRTGPGTSGR